MQCTLGDALTKVEQMDAIIKRIDDDLPLCDLDLEIVRELLDDYREILLNFKVKIG
jgi:hypothetical protein